MYTITRDGLMVDVKVDDEFEEKAQFIHFEDLDLENAVEIGRGASGVVIHVVHIPTGMSLVLKKISVAEMDSRNEIKRELDLLSSKLGCSPSWYDSMGPFMTMDMCILRWRSCTLRCKIVF
jgi:hypothetical protein